jgi:hypothetical protein
LEISSRRSLTPTRRRFRTCQAGNPSVLGTDGLTSRLPLGRRGTRRGVGLAF